MYVGFALDSSGKPVSEVHVRLFRKHGMLLSDTSKPVADLCIDSTSTDKSGRFSFDISEAGIYACEAREFKQMLTGISNDFYFQPQEQDYTPDTVFLRSSGSIRGTVTRGGVLGTSGNTTKQDAFINVLIKEVARNTVTAQEGQFEFSGLAEGVYTLCFYADDGFFTIKIDSVKVTAGQETVVDTVELQRIPWVTPPKPTGLSAVYDTISGQVTLQWNSINYSAIRGYEVIRFDSSWKENGSFTTIDTVFTDDLRSFSSGTILSYVVRTVNLVFERSYNEGPVDIIVK